MRAETTEQVVLVVEDEPEVRSYLEKTLRCEGYEVEIAQDGDEALSVLEKCPAIRAVLLDVFIPGIDGIQLLRQIRRSSPDLAVIMISGTASSGRIVDAMRAGADDFLGKPVSRQTLNRSLENVLGRAVQPAVLEHVPSPRARGAIFYGSNPAMQTLQKMIPAVAWSKAPVLVLGETGVGKEVVARELHGASQRAHKPFTKLNCAALPSELVESELFGYERGAFTDAYQRKLGMFENADGGTLLLDEIGDMDFKLQAKLLQVLQDSELHRLGGKETIHVDVRVIAATHNDLEQAIVLGRFREDLYYRLNVVTLYVPPLRDRVEDILPMAEFLLRHHSTGSAHHPEITPSLQHALLAHSWPGNVRELENVIQKLLVLNDPEVVVQELTARAKKHRQLRPDDAPGPPARIPSFEPLILEEVAKAKNQAESEAIMAALQAARWNRKKAAAMLRIDYKALLYKIKKLGIDDSPVTPNQFGASSV